MKEGNSQNLFIIGAGFTKAANVGAPLNDKLLSDIIGATSDPLKKYYEKYKCDDIEKLLTLIDLEVEPNAELRNDRVAINQQIGNYFTRFRFKKDKIPEWIKGFAIDILKPNDAIISLNYDCYLEGALDYFKVWTPNEGYPIKNPLADEIEPNPKNILIYKIHGSEHFRESEVYGTDQTSICFLIEEEIFPVSGLRKHFGAGMNARPYIIAPSFVKVPHVDIAYMMVEVIELAKKARNLIIIGCGMRREDTFLSLVLTRFLYGSPKEDNKKLIILSPDAEKINERIKRYTEPASNRVKIELILTGVKEGLVDLQKELELS